MRRDLNGVAIFTAAAYALICFIELPCVLGQNKVMADIHAAYKDLEAYGDEGLLTFRLNLADGTSKTRELRAPVHRISKPDLLVLSFGAREYVQTTTRFFEVDHASKEVREGDVSEFSWKTRWQRTEPDPQQKNGVGDAASLLIGTLLALQNGNTADLKKRFKIESFADTKDNTRGIVFSAKRGDIQLRCYLNQGNLVEKATCAAPQGRLKKSGTGDAVSLQITWQAGAITSKRQQVITALKQRVVGIDKRIQKYDRVPVNPAGKPGPNFVRIEQTIWQRLGSLIDWIRGS